MTQSNMQIATITSKRQLTIPASIFRLADLKEGQKVLVTAENGKIQIEAAVDLVERLAGSVKVPSRFKGLPLEKIIKEAKRKHFQQK